MLPLFKWTRQVPLLVSVSTGLRIGATLAVGSKFIIKYLDAFLATYPKIKVQLITTLPGQVPESNIDVLTLSIIQGIANLCNSALLGANVAFLEEARLLYESIIVKTYINIKFENDECVVNKYFEEEYSTSVECFDELVNKFKEVELNDAQQYQLKKFMMVFF